MKGHGFDAPIPAGGALESIEINVNEVTVGDYTVGDWDISVDVEGGQPNGGGQIEESGARDWYSDDRENHHRTVITLYGPWQPGAREHIEEKRRRQAEHDAQVAAAAEEDLLRRADEIRARRATTTKEQG